VRRLFLALSLGCFIGAAVCFGVSFVGVLRVVAEMPGIEVGISQVKGIKAWVWWFLGLALAGFASLWMVRESLKARSDDTPAGSA
jgi:hypothetical protein